MEIKYLSKKSIAFVFCVLLFVVFRPKHSMMERKYSMPWAQNKNSNTLKIECNPETHQLNGEEVVISPIELELDAS